MHMSMCRLVRPSNGFNKKLENQTAALALCCLHYNFVRIRQTLRVTPATATGVIKKLWKVPDIMALLNREYHLTHYRPMNSTGRPPAETANHHPARAGDSSTAAPGVVGDYPGEPACASLGYSRHPTRGGYGGRRLKSNRVSDYAVISGFSDP